MGLVLRHFSRGVIAQSNHVTSASTASASASSKFLLFTPMRTAERNAPTQSHHKGTSAVRFSSGTPSNRGERNDPDAILSSFANLDHHRASRTGFPEAVFGEGKTPRQIQSILESMAKNVNELAAKEGSYGASSTVHSSAANAILATRIDRDLYEGILSIGPLSNGVMKYHETARIVSVHANALVEADGAERNLSSSSSRKRVVVACAGTTDLPVAEEAAVTLELSGVVVDRVYDAGVAGLHRIINALPKLRHPDVGCVVVCAGMDGALPSVVGGLVDVPVVAVPTSVGYGVSLGGVSALLTMLNSCSPGVGVVNVDNGFGAAALAFKCINIRG